MNRCPQCGETITREMTDCPRCGCKLPPALPGPPARKNLGYGLLYGVVFALAAVFMWLAFENFYAIPLAAAFSLGLTCMVFVLRWRPPPGTPTSSVIGTYVIFTAGIFLGGLAALIGGCAFMMRHN